MPLQIIDGFKVTVCDSPLANYGRWNGLAIFDEYSYVETQNLIHKYGNLFQQKDELSSNAVEDNKRNSYFFGLLKSAILFAKKYLYDRGGYLSGKFMGQEITSLIYIFRCEGRFS